MTTDSGEASYRPWIEAWRDALYGKNGFYRRSEGPAGHFATSAQGIPGVDAILAQAVWALAQDAGVSAIVDFAAGRGELLGQLSHLVPDEVTLIGVDVVARPGTLPARVSWVVSGGDDDVPDLFLDGRRALVLAHEWLDVVACDVAERDESGQLRRVCVDSRGAEALGEALDSAQAQWVSQWWPESDPTPGARVEVGLTRDAAWARLVDAVRTQGGAGSVIVGVDYGHTVADRPVFGTLTGFRDGSEASPTPDGCCDITAHVAVDSLGAQSVTTQRELLMSIFGEAPLAPPDIGLAHTDPPRYLEALSVRSAYAAAVAPDGLGGFYWFSTQV